MKKILSLLTLFILSASVSRAQNQHFTTSGTIEYEKRANMFALIQKQLWDDTQGSFAQQAFDAYKKGHPQFKVMKSMLTFANNKTLYAPVDDAQASGSYFDNIPMASQPNTVFTDLAASHNVSQKQVFEQTFLLSDSVRNIHWKITDETRDIAGYPCRRANAIVMDSIYVVAFFTEKIHVSGGPENFGGLPGMILGLALPHENVTWFATKVTDMPVDEKTIAPPKKGKPVNNASLKTTLQAVMKDWGKEARQDLKAFLL
jgi:GLPGLI family protein